MPNTTARLSEIFDRKMGRFWLANRTSCYFNLSANPPRLAGRSGAALFSGAICERVGTFGITDDSFVMPVGRLLADAICSSASRFINRFADKPRDAASACKARVSGCGIRKIIGFVRFDTP
jgi:hypothetical protein